LASESGVTSLVPKLSNT